MTFGEHYKGLKAELPPLIGLDIAWDYVYIEDVIDAYLLATTRVGQEPGAIYNVGKGVQISLREVVEVAGSVLEIAVPPQWVYMSNRHWDTTVWVSDNKKIWDELGGRPQYGINQGFRQMVNWFRENPALWEIYRGPYPQVE